LVLVRFSPGFSVVGANGDFTGMRGGTVSNVMNNRAVGQLNNLIFIAITGDVGADMPGESLIIAITDITEEIIVTFTGFKVPARDYESAGSGLYADAGTGTNTSPGFNVGNLFGYIDRF